MTRAIAISRNHSISAESQARLRRIARPWRIALALYALALLVATHWPKLTLGPAVPASDKMIHLVAYVGLTILFWRARLLRHLPMLGVCLLLWAAIDEFSQGIPFLYRTVSLYDLLTNALGVLLAVAWIWALQPVGLPGGANRMRLKSMALIVDEMFAARRPWMAALLAAGAGAVLLAALWRFFHGDTKRIVIMGVMLGTAAATLGIWLHLWRMSAASICQAKPCLSCGAASLNASRTSSTADQRCLVCGAPMHPAQWIMPPGPLPIKAMQLGLRPAILGVAIIILVFLVIPAAPLLYSSLLGAGGRIGWVAPRLARVIGTMPPEFTNAVDLAGLLLLLAVIVRLYRSRLAKFYDRGAVCMNCGHDLRGTPVLNGIGRCGECGAAFVRITSTTESLRDLS